MSKENSDEKDSWLGREDYSGSYDKWRRPSKNERAREQALNDWYGKDFAGREIVAHRQDFKSINDLVQDVEKRFGLEEENIYNKMLSNWSEIAGEELKGQIFPVAVKGDCLNIEVGNSSIMYMLNGFMRKHLVENVIRISEGKLKDIRFVPKGRGGHR